MSAMGKPTFECELHQLFAWWGHVFEPLPEGDNGEAEAFEVLAHLDSSPPVERDLANIEPSPELLDEGFDRSVMNDVAFRGL